MLANPLKRELLPVRVAFRGVDAQHVGTGLHQRRHALGVVARVDARAHHVALVRVQHLVGIRLMRVVVLAEHQVHEAIVVVHHGQGVQLVVPDDVVGNLEAGVGRSHDHLLARGHEVGHLRVHGHTGQTVVAIGDHAHQLAVRRTVGGDGHGGVTVLLLEGYHVGQRHLGREVRVAGDEAGLVVLDASDHSGLVLDGLGAVHERQAAFGSKRDGHAVVGHSLHDGGHHGDVQRDGGLFAALELHERRLQADFGGNALGRRIAGNEQVLVKGSGRLVEIVCHDSSICGRCGVGVPRSAYRSAVHPLLRCYPLL